MHGSLAQTKAAALAGVKGYAKAAAKMIMMIRNMHFDYIGFIGNYDGAAITRSPFEVAPGEGVIIFEAPDIAEKTKAADVSNMRFQTAAVAKIRKSQITVLEFNDLLERLASCGGAGQGTDYGYI